VRIDSGRDDLHDSLEDRPDTRVVRRGLLEDVQMSGTLVEER